MYIGPEDTTSVYYLYVWVPYDIIIVLSSLNYLVYTIVTQSCSHGAHT